MMRPILLLLLAMVPLATWAQAPDASASGSAWVRVEAAGAEAVLVDGEIAGLPEAWIAVAPGPHRVEVVSDPEAWDALRAATEIDASADDSLRLALDLPRRLRVETLPIRALVVLESPSGIRDTLGTAPLTVDLPPDAAGDLVATLDGYSAARLPLADAAAGGPTTLLLQAAPGAEPELALLPTQRSLRTRTLVDAGIAAASVAAAALAVHYKFRADAVDDDYRSEDPALRGNESLRQEALRLDRYSAIALGAMQVGVGALAIRFVLR